MKNALIAKKALPAKFGVVYSRRQVAEWLGTAVGPTMYIEDTRTSTPVGYRKEAVKSIVKENGHPEYFTFVYGENGKLEVSKA